MVKMEKTEKQNFIADRVAQEFEDGFIVNLGIGLPTLVANHIPDKQDVTLQSENGFIGLGPAPSEDNIDPSIANAGGAPVTIKEGGAFFDSNLSFGIIRGGHVDATVLGALEVDEKGSIANYMIPGKMVPGMGGAMDLVTGAKKVIVAMEHTNRGNPKILKECKLPLTASQEVDMIITEMGVMEVTEEGIKLIEKNPQYSFEEIQKETEASLIKAYN